MAAIVPRVRREIGVSSRYSGTHSQDARREGTLEIMTPAGRRDSRQRTAYRFVGGMGIMKTKAKPPKRQRKTKPRIGKKMVEIAGPQPAADHAKKPTDFPKTDAEPTSLRDRLDAIPRYSRISAMSGVKREDFPVWSRRKLRRTIARSGGDVRKRVFLKGRTRGGDVFVEDDASGVLRDRERGAAHFSIRRDCSTKSIPPHTRRKAGAKESGRRRSGPLQRRRELHPLTPVSKRRPHAHARPSRRWAKTR